MLESVQVDENAQLLFFYGLKNNGKAPYQVSDGSHAILFIKSRNKKKPLEAVTQDQIRIIYPVDLLPGRQQVVMLRDLRQTQDFTTKLKLNPSNRQFSEYEKKVETHIDKVWPDLGGFILCDAGNQVRIELPKGW